MSLLFLFACKPGTERAGCVERVMVEGPFVIQTGIDPATRQPKYAPDVAKAGAWCAAKLKELGYPLPGGAFDGEFKGRCAQQTQPSIICVQSTLPTLDPTAVNSGQPWGPPVANGVNMAPPPMVGPQRAPGTVDYEPLDPSALPRTQDGLFEDGDAQGGTYADIDAMTKTETVRDVGAAKPYDPRDPRFVQRPVR